MGGDTRAEAGAAAGTGSVAIDFSMSADRWGEGGLAGAGLGASATAGFVGCAGAADETAAPSTDRAVANDGFEAS